jgi:hypothetical protein
MENQPQQPQVPQDGGWLQDDPQPTPAEYRKLMLSDLPKYHGPLNQSWSSHVRRLELAWAAYRVPAHDIVNRRNALLLSLAGQAAEMASHLLGEAGLRLTYEQVKMECELLFRPAYESATLKQAFKDYRQQPNEPIQAYVSTKCALYRDAYSHEDQDMLIEELTAGIRNPNVRRIVSEREYATLAEYTKTAMFAVTVVVKQLGWGVATMDSADGLAGAAGVQLPKYGGPEPMEIGSMAASLNQIRKTAGISEAARAERRCFSCQGTGHLAKECPSPQVADTRMSRPARPRQGRADRCERCTLEGHTAAECRADWTTASRRQREIGQRNQRERARPALTHLGDEATPPAPAPAPTTAAQDTVPKFGTVPARINMMSGPYEKAQVTGFGLHHMGVAPPIVASVQEPAKMPHFSLNAMMPAAPPQLDGWTSIAGATDLTDLPDLMEDAETEEEEATSVAGLDPQEEWNERETSPRPGAPAEPSRMWVLHPRTQGEHLAHQPHTIMYQDDFISWLYSNFDTEPDLSAPPAPGSKSPTPGLKPGSTVRSALEPPGLGREGITGVSVPPAPTPHVTGHGLELALATLSLEGTPLVPAGAAHPGNGGGHVAAHSNSSAAPDRPPVVCQSPIGRGVGEDKHGILKPQWKRVKEMLQRPESPEERDQPPLQPSPASPVSNPSSRPSSPRRHLLEMWQVRRSCSHWWMVLWILILGAVWPAASYVLTGWDCANPTHVTAFNKDKLCEQGPNYLEQPLEQKHMVLQHVKVREAKGYSCELTVSQWTFRCGVWGHLKVTSVPTLQRPQKIDPEACRDLARTRVYEIQGKTGPLSFQLNHPLFFTVDMVGALVNSPSGVGCEGEDVHFEGQLYRNELVLQERRLLVKEETYIVEDDQVESMTDHLTLPCPYTELSCVTGQATYIWEHLGRDCPLRLVRSILPSLVLDAFLVDHQAQFFINRTGPVSIVNCPFETYATSHEELYISTDPAAAELPRVSARDMNIPLQAQVHAAYVGFTLEAKMRTAAAEEASSNCWKLQQLDPAHPVRVQGSIFSILRGDVLLQLSCTRHKFVIRESAECWDKVPVEPTGFVDAITKVYSDHATKIPCSTTYPLTVHAEEGWIELTPAPKKRPPPLDTPKHLLMTAVDDFSQGGLYSQQELSDWRELLAFPAYKAAMLTGLSYGSCLQRGSCAAAGEHDIPAYDLDKLVETSSEALDLWAGFRRAIHEWGDGAAILCLILFLLKLLGDLAIISMAAAQGGLRAAMNAVSQVFLYHPGLYRKALARAKAGRPRSRDLSIDWDAIPIGREAAEEMISMRSSCSDNENSGKPGNNAGGPNHHPGGPTGGGAPAPTVSVTASAPAAATVHQHTPLLTGPAAAAPYGGPGYPTIEPMPASRQTSKFYPLLATSQP